jgi:hypothetical protein
MATVPFAAQAFGMENTETQQPQTCWPIVELRQYTLHPGQRDVLIDLFDREFVESQEALGMKVIGQFRDLDNPDRFVWLRGSSGHAFARAGAQGFLRRAGLEGASRNGQRHHNRF